MSTSENPNTCSHPETPDTSNCQAMLDGCLATLRQVEPALRVLAMTPPEEWLSKEQIQPVISEMHKVVATAMNACSHAIDTSLHPLPQEPGAWYWGEEDLHGPFLSQQEAAEDAEENLEAPADPSLIGFYVHKRVNLAKYFDAEEWLGRVSEQLADTDFGGDEYGDHDPIFEIDNTAGADLQNCVRQAIWDWQRRHQLQLTSWWMDQIDPPKETDHG